MDIASYIDHTLLAANASSEQISKLCNEALEYHFASVCINSCRVKECAKKLKNSDVAVCTVVGFPLGAMSTEAKAFEAKKAIEDGADEIDMVINIGWLKESKDDLVLKDIQNLKEVCGDKILKVIIETCLLSDEEKVKACALAKKAGADFVKTSTGFSKWGAKVEDVALMRKSVGKELGVKASGGIHNYEEALAMIDAGASRLGASCGVAIVTGANSNAEY
ncbi:MAG: deoxyribose-phosphate aldolase [Pleomorphochaeta sp.]